MVNQQAYLQRVQTLVNIDSGSHNPQGINAVNDVLASWYRDIGWHVQRHDLGTDTGHVLVISNTPSEHYDMMFVGHTDTVFPDGTAKQRPFSQDAQHAYGPGVADMKNGDVAMYEVATHLSAEALATLRICMVHNPDEEIGSIYSKDLLDELAKKTDYIYVMESCEANNTHCFARKGILRYTLHFTGQAAHSGFMFQREHASAVLEMAHYITTLSALASREKDTTVNVGTAQGGTATNVVPEHASITVEMRFWTKDEKERIRNAVQTLLSGPPVVKGVSVSVQSFEECEPWEHTEKGDAHVAKIKSIAQAKGIEFNERDRGGLSDANHLAGQGAICCDGMGPHGDLDHGEKEYMQIASVEPCVSLLCAIAEDLAQSKRTPVVHS